MTTVIGDGFVPSVEGDLLDALAYPGGVGLAYRAENSDDPSAEATGSYRGPESRSAPSGGSSRCSRRACSPVGRRGGASLPQLSQVALNIRAGVRCSHHRRPYPPPLPP